MKIEGTHKLLQCPKLENPKDMKSNLSLNELLIISLDDYLVRKLVESKFAKYHTVKRTSNSLCSKTFYQKGITEMQSQNVKIIEHWILPGKFLKGKSFWETVSFKPSQNIATLLHQPFDPFKTSLYPKPNKSLWLITKRINVTVVILTSSYLT